MSYLERIQSSDISRRGFVKASAAAVAALSVAGIAGCAPNSVEETEETTTTEARDIVSGEWKSAACWHNCGGRCVNKVLVRDGVAIRQKTDDSHEDSPEYFQQRSCVRGHSQRMQCFGAEAERLGTEARFNTFGRQLIMENGKVVGLLAEDEKGNVIKVEAPVVSIGTGGYANNHEFLYGVSETKNVNIQALGMECRDGDDVKMAKAAGAAMAEGLGTVMWCGPVTLGAVTATWTTDAYSAGVQPTLWLNQNGERFCKEDLWIDDFAGAGIAVRNQDRTFALFTETDMKRWEAQGPDGQVFSFGTSGTPLAKAREDLMNAEGCHVGDGYYTTCGGIKVNEKTQILDEEGQVIPGLYAGGSDAGGLYGDSYDVKFAPGSQAGWAVNSGRLAVKDAKEYPRQVAYSAGQRLP